MVNIFAVSTRPLLPPKDDLNKVMLESLPTLKNRDILVFTSKVVAIAQGRCVAIDEVKDKNALIASEAQAMIPKASSKYNIALTIKENTLIASSGIDESNGNGYYTFWPVNSSAWAEQTCRMLKKHFGLTELGVIVTDSHCVPMRWGVVGISIGFYGFKPLSDYRGKPDIFGRPLQVSQGNIVDAISAAAVGVMGEGNECTPLVVVREWPRVEFTDKATHEGFSISPEEDIFEPLLRAFDTLTS